RSMGCEVVVAGASPEALRRIEALFDEHDRVFSRFRPGSELSRVNRRRGGFARVSALFAATVEAALDAAAWTGGLVDPTLGAATSRLVGRSTSRCPAAAPSGWCAARSPPAGARQEHGSAVDASNII